MLELKVNPRPVVGDEYPDHPMEWFWRVESSYHWGFDGECLATIHFARYALLRHTPKGVWVVPYDTRDAHFEFQKHFKKLVFHNTWKRFAYPTKAEAWESFVIRQQHRVQHARNALQAAETVYALTQKENIYVPT